MRNISLILAEHETFETDRLLLRKIGLADAPDMFEFASDPEVARYVSYRPHESLERTQSDIVRHFLLKRLESWGIVDKSSDRLIGTINLSIKEDQGSFGWTLHRKYWGQGIMPEAAAVLRDFAFDELGINVLVAEHYQENQKSGRVMAKLGMKKIGQIWIYVAKEEKSVLADYWAMTKNDYEKLKE